MYENYAFQYILSCYLLIGKFSFLVLLMNATDRISIGLHVASRCILWIEIHAQVFLWLRNQYSSIIFFPLKEPYSAEIIIIIIKGI